MVMYSIPKKSCRYPWSKHPEPNEAMFEVKLRHLISGAKLEGVTDEMIARTFADALSYYHTMGKF